MSDFMEFGFGDNDDSLSNQKFARFKGKEGESYRVSFVWWPTLADGRPDLSANTPRFTGAKRIYIPNVGYVLDKGPEYAAFGQSKLQVATIIAQWPTNRHGEIDRVRFANGEVDVKPWIFGKDKYEMLKRRHGEWPFNTYDLGIACTDTQYQKMDLSPCRDSYFRKVSEANGGTAKTVFDSIVAQVATISAQINDILARDLPIDKIREKLAGGPAPSPRGGNSGTGGASAFSQSADIDGLLDDMS